ncbi:MAG: DUF2125 domain-containing protein [Flavobacteriaceae bacterium]
MSRRKRRPWIPVFSLLLVVALAIGWTAVWHFASTEASRRFDELLAREAAAGRDWTCENREDGGWPYRVEISCDRLTGRVLAGAQSYDVVAGDFRILALAYRPNHVIAELGAPLTVTKPDGGDPLLEARWDLLHASARGRPGAVESADIAVEGLQGSAPGLADFPGVRNAFAAERAEIHARDAGRSGDTADIEVAASGSGIVYAPDEGSPPPFGLDGRGMLRNVPLRPQGRPAAALASAGSSAEIARLRLDQQGSTIHLDGTVRLDAQSRPAGTLRLAARGGDLTTPGAEGAFGGILPILAMALRFTGKPVEIDGEPASAADIVIADGEIRLGPVVLGKVGPLR